MPFGVKNGPAVFQRLSDRVLTDCMEFIRVYIDDMIVFSHDVQSHCGHLREVLKLLEQSGLTANRAKWENPLYFLGHVVGGGKVAPSDFKVMAIRNAPLPMTKKQDRQFLGLAQTPSTSSPDHSNFWTRRQQATPSPSLP